MLKLIKQVIWLFMWCNQYWFVLNVAEATDWYLSVAYAAGAWCGKWSATIYKPALEKCMLYCR